MRRASHLRRVPSSSERPAAPEVATAIQRGEVVAVASDGAPEVAIGAEPPVRATMSLVVASWRPSVGDRVLVCFDRGLAVVVGVLVAARTPALALSDGSSVHVDGGRMRLLDPEGRMLVVYAEGRAEITAPSGDLHLRAPSGAVRIEAATDVRLEATRDVVAAAGRSAELKVDAADGELAPKIRVDRARVAVAAPELRADARVAMLHAASAAAIVRELSLAAEKLVTKAATIDTTAERVAYRTKTLMHQVSGLLETKAGRVRALVAGAWSVRSQSTALRSVDDTSIDGKRVMLG